MKNLILISIILQMTNSVSAEKTQSEKKQQARLDYEESIQLYGVDDTSIAIINIYFDKRYSAGVGQLSFLPVTAAFAFFIPPIGVVLMAVSSPMYINGAIKFNKYSQKNMIKTLNNYHKNNILAEKIRDKVVDFIIDENMDSDNLMEENIALLKLKN
jgi:hypothetical protein